MKNSTLAFLLTPFSGHKVFFNQLPEQIREHEHYRGVHMFGYVWLNEEQGEAVVQYYPDCELGEMLTDSWVKTARDGWVKQ